MKRTRKGFTLVELLIVIAIIGVLAAMLTLSAGSSTATAKAATIYSNIRTIKMAGLMYQIQSGDAFKESNVDAAALYNAKIISLDNYNKTSGNNNNIQYKIVKGNGDAGAYVICQFKDDTDKKAIATALKGYKDLRVDDTTNYTAGAFFYHFTEAEKGAEDYDADMSFGS